MPSAAEKNNLATKYSQDAAYAALFTTTTTSAAAGTEVTGGTYARVAISWGAASGGVITGTATINVPAGITVIGAGAYTLASGGVYTDGGAVASQTFGSAGTYTLTLTYTQS